MSDSVSAMRIIYEAIRKPALAAGFRGTSNRTLVRHEEQIDQYLHLDKSTYGGRNILQAFFNPKRPESMFKTINQIPAVLRLERICPPEFALSAALNTESDLNIEARKNSIITAMEQFIVPLLNATRTANGVLFLERKYSDKNDFTLLPKGRAILKSMIGPA